MPNVKKLLTDAMLYVPCLVMNRPLCHIIDTVHSYQTATTLLS